VLDFSALITLIVDVLLAPFVPKKPSFGRPDAW
jgi:hypothetical protein